MGAGLVELGDSGELWTGGFLPALLACSQVENKQPGSKWSGTLARKLTQNEHLQVALGLNWRPGAGQASVLGH